MRQKVDRLTDELHNLSTKKKDAWLHLHNATSRDIEVLKQRYKHLHKLTRAADCQAAKEYMVESLFSRGTRVWLGS